MKKSGNDGRKPEEGGVLGSSESTSMSSFLSGVNQMFFGTPGKGSGVRWSPFSSSGQFVPDEEGQVEMRSSPLSVMSKDGRDGQLGSQRPWGEVWDDEDTSNPNKWVLGRLVELSEKLPVKEQTDAQGRLSVLGRTIQSYLELEVRDDISDSAEVAEIEEQIRQFADAAEEEIVSAMCSGVNYSEEMLAAVACVDVLYESEVTEVTVDQVKERLRAEYKEGSEAGKVRNGSSVEGGGRSSPVTTREDVPSASRSGEGAPRAAARWRAGGFAHSYGEGLPHGDERASVDSDVTETEGRKEMKKSGLFGLGGKKGTDRELLFPEDSSSSAVTASVTPGSGRTEGENVVNPLGNPAMQPEPVYTNAISGYEAEYTRLDQELYKAQRDIADASRKKEGLVGVALVRAEIEHLNASQKGDIIINNQRKNLLAQRDALEALLAIEGVDKSSYTPKLRQLGEQLNNPDAPDYKGDKEADIAERVLQIEGLEGLVSAHEGYIRKKAGLTATSQAAQRTYSEAAAGEIKLPGGNNAFGAAPGRTWPQLEGLAVNNVTAAADAGSLFASMDARRAVMAAKAEAYATYAEVVVGVLREHEAAIPGNTELEVEYTRDREQIAANMRTMQQGLDGVTVTRQYNQQQQDRERVQRESYANYARKKEQWDRQRAAVAFDNSAITAAEGKIRDAGDDLGKILAAEVNLSEARKAYAQAEQANITTLNDITTAERDALQALINAPATNEVQGLKSAYTTMQRNLPALAAPDARRVEGFENERVRNQELLEGYTAYVESKDNRDRVIDTASRELVDAVALLQLQRDMQGVPKGTIHEQLVTRDELRTIDAQIDTLKEAYYTQERGVYGARALLAAANSTAADGGALTGSSKDKLKVFYTQEQTASQEKEDAAGAMLDEIGRRRQVRGVEAQADQEFAEASLAIAGLDGLNGKTWDKLRTEAQRAVDSADLSKGIVDIDQAITHRDSIENALAEALDARDRKVLTKLGEQHGALANGHEKDAIAAQMTELQKGEASRRRASEERFTESERDVAFLQAYRAFSEQKSLVQDKQRGDREQFERNDAGLYIPRITAAREEVETSTLAIKEGRDIARLLDARQELREAEHHRSETEGLLDTATKQGITFLTKQIQGDDVNSGLQGLAGHSEKFKSLVAAELQALTDQSRNLDTQQRARVEEESERTKERDKDSKLRESYEGLLRGWRETGQLLSSAESDHAYTNLQQELSIKANAYLSNRTDPRFRESFFKTQEDFDAADAAVDSLRKAVAGERALWLGKLQGLSDHIPEAQEYFKTLGTQQETILHEISDREQRRKDNAAMRSAARMGSVLQGNAAGSEAHRNMQADLGTTNKEEEAAYKLIDATLYEAASVNPSVPFDKGRFVKTVFTRLRSDVGTGLEATIIEWERELESKDPVTGPKDIIHGSLDIFIDTISHNVRDVKNAIAVDPRTVRLIADAMVVQKVLDGTDGGVDYAGLRRSVDAASRNTAAEGFSNARFYHVHGEINKLIKYVQENPGDRDYNGIREVVTEIAAGLDYDSAANKLYGEKGEGLLEKKPTAMDVARPDEKKLYLYSLLKLNSEVHGEKRGGEGKSIAAMYQHIHDAAQAQAIVEGRRPSEEHSMAESVKALAAAAEKDRQNEWRALNEDPTRPLKANLDKDLKPKLHWESDFTLREGERALRHDHKFGVGATTFSAMIVKAGIASGEAAPKPDEIVERVKLYEVSHPDIYKKSPANRAVELAVAAAVGEAKVDERKLEQAKKQALSHYMVASIKRPAIDGKGVHLTYNRYFDTKKDEEKINQIADALAKSDSISYADLEGIAADPAKMDKFQEKILQAARKLESQNSLGDAKIVQAAVEGARVKYERDTGTKLEGELDAPSKAGAPLDSAGSKKIDDEVTQRKAALAKREEKHVAEKNYEHAGPNKNWKMGGIAGMLLSIVLLFISPPAGVLLMAACSAAIYRGWSQEHKAKMRPGLLASEDKAIEHEKLEIAELEKKRTKEKEIEGYSATVSGLHPVVQEELQVRFGTKDARSTAEALAELDQKGRTDTLSQATKESEAMGEIQASLEVMKKAGAGTEAKKTYEAYVSEAGDEMTAAKAIASSPELREEVHKAVSKLMTGMAPASGEPASLPERMASKAAAVTSRM